MSSKEQQAAMAQRQTDRAHLETFWLMRGKMLTLMASHRNDVDRTELHHRLMAVERAMQLLEPIAAKPASSFGGGRRRKGPSSDKSTNTQETT